MTDAEWDQAIDLRAKIYDLATEACARLTEGDMASAYKLAAEVTVLERELAQVGHPMAAVT